MCVSAFLFVVPGAFDLLSQPLTWALLPTKCYERTFALTAIELIQCNGVRQQTCDFAAVAAAALHLVLICYNPKISKNTLPLFSH